MILTFMVLAIAVVAIAIGIAIVAGRALLSPREEPRIATARAAWRAKRHEARATADAMRCEVRR